MNSIALHLKFILFWERKEESETFVMGEEIT